MQKRIFDCKKCKECSKVCMIPSWTYCSDDCRRINLNKRGVLSRQKKKVVKLDK